MRHAPATILLTLVLLLTASCGAFNGPSQQTGPVRTETIKETKYVFYKDNHKLSRRNADRIFDEWSEGRNLHRNITKRALRSVSPKADGCHLVYDFRLVDGTWQRVDLKVLNYEQKYRRKPRKTEKVNVNGWQYELHTR